MTFDEFQSHRTAQATRTQERRKLEAGFNAEIIRRHRAGETKDHNDRRPRRYTAD